MQPVNNLSLWELNSYNAPNNLDIFLKSLDWLTNNENWIYANPDKAEKYFRQLEITYISPDSNIAAKTLSLYRTLLTKHSLLFPCKTQYADWATFQCNDKKVDIPKSLLGLISPVLYSAFQGGMKESGDHATLNLDLSEDETDCFIKYFLEDFFDEKNVLTLLQLSSFYLITNLKNRCLGFINSNLDINNFKEILFAAHERGLRDLQLICLLYAHRNSETLDLKFLKQEDLPNEIQELSKLAWHLKAGVIKKLNIIFSHNITTLDLEFDLYGIYGVIYDMRDQLVEISLSDLKKLNDILPIDRLVFSCDPKDETARREEQVKTVLSKTQQL